MKEQQASLDRVTLAKLIRPLVRPSKAKQASDDVEERVALDEGLPGAFC
jgi:hypothetical protein